MTDSRSSHFDLAVAREAAFEWLRADGCGCCTGDDLKVAQRKMAEALGLGYYENYAGELCFLKPGEEAPDG